MAGTSKTPACIKRSTLVELLPYIGLDPDDQNPSIMRARVATFTNCEDEAAKKDTDLLLELTGIQCAQTVSKSVNPSDYPEGIIPDGSLDDYAEWSVMSAALDEYYEIASSRVHELVFRVLRTTRVAPEDTEPFDPTVTAPEYDWNGLRDEAARFLKEKLLLLSKYKETESDSEDTVVRGDVSDIGRLSDLVDSVKLGGDDQEEEDDARTGDARLFSSQKQQDE